VHQKELFFSSLNCREHLTFHAINRLSSKYDLDYCYKRVDEVRAQDSAHHTRAADNQPDQSDPRIGLADTWLAVVSRLLPADGGGVCLCAAHPSRCSGR
jgi:hypothetical protein